MKRYLLLMLVMCGWMGTLSGCVEPKTSAGYAVMFEKPAHIIDTGVYAKGMEIGRIVSRETGANNAEKVSVDIDAAFEHLMTRNAVFFVSAGRMNRTLVAAWGEALPMETPLLGFPSGWSLRLFRLKTALAQSARVATVRAEQLLGGM